MTQFKCISSSPRFAVIQSTSPRPTPPLSNRRECLCRRHEMARTTPPPSRNRVERTAAPPWANVASSFVRQDPALLASRNMLVARVGRPNEIKRCGNAHILIRADHTSAGPRCTGCYPGYDNLVFPPPSPSFSSPPPLLLFSPGTRIRIHLAKANETVPFPSL